MKGLSILCLALLGDTLAQGNPPGPEPKPGHITAATQESPQLRVIRAGTQAPRKGSEENFTGSVHVDPLVQAEPPSWLTGAYVTFDPGARAAWHSHPVGQSLIVTRGTGRVQSWGGPVEEIRPGDVVRIPPGANHWHGASPTASMTHIALVEELDGKSTPGKMA